MFLEAFSVVSLPGTLVATFACLRVFFAQLHQNCSKATNLCKTTISFSISLPNPPLSLRLNKSSQRPCKKHVRFQEENFHDSIYDYSLGGLMQEAKIRRVEGESPEEFDHFHVGGTTLCADYAKRAMLDTAKVAAECGQKRCKYINNYPTSASLMKRSARFSSIFV